MKKCGVCQQSKPLSEFNKKGNGYQYKCRSCQREWYKNYYDNVDKEKVRVLANNADNRVALRVILREKKDVPCMDCHQRYPYFVMDFDHRDPSKKSFDVARMVSKGKSISALLKEIKKCDVVCSNCHRIRTYSSVV